MATTTTWEDYLAPSSQSSAIPLNVSGLLRQLEDPEGIYFSDDEINVRITDIGDATAVSHVYDDAEELGAALNRLPQGRMRIRIISIYSECTIDPLQINSALMCQIFSKYNIHPDFLRIVFSFGEEPHLAEASSGNLAIHSSPPGQTDICYQVNYVEENMRKGQDLWSFRHTGIYHHHTSDFDLYILLHPNQHSVLETHLLKTLGLDSSTESNQPQLSAFKHDPYRIHLLVFSSFFDNWRWYFRYLGNRFARENNQAMVVKPESADAESSFQRVQNLRNMNDFALFAKACCVSSLGVVEQLKSSAATPLKDASDMDVQMTTLRGYVESSDALQSRIRNAIDLVGYTLTLHNSLETAKVDNELRDITQELRDMTEKLKNLTQDTVDDSATVRIVTYVSAFYLPGSFVASLYGMNFFVFDTDSRSIVIGHNFWVFVVTWLPLTFITAAIFILTLWLDARRKGKRFPWPWTRRNRPPPPAGKIR